MSARLAKLGRHSAISTRLSRPILSSQYATVSDRVVKISTQNRSPTTPTIPKSIHSAVHVPPAFDKELLSELSQSAVQSLNELNDQYNQFSGHVLDIPLPYEPTPPNDRKLRFGPQDSDQQRENGVLAIAHCIDGGNDHRVALSSGFALNIPISPTGEYAVVTCAHTFEEIRRSPILPRASKSGSYVISPSITSKELERHQSIHAVSSVLSSLPRSDILVLSAKLAHGARTLPVSPYPAQPDTAIRAHFVSSTKPEESGWTPWIGGMWSKWVRGTVLGYRDFAGREAKPGTYDALSHMLFKPPPTAGSSGGPIVDEKTGAVVGMMLGSRMDNRVEGVRGWGVPSEAIFEMFQLPGLRLKSKKD